MSGLNDLTRVGIAEPQGADHFKASLRQSPILGIRGLAHWWSPRFCYTNAGGTIVPTNGQEILRANDLGPGATNATATAANGLTFIENAFGSFPGWQSTDGSNDCLTATGALSNAYQSAFSVYVLIKRDTNGDTICPVGGDDWYIVRSGDSISGATNDLTDTQTDLAANLGIIGVAWMTWDGSTRRVGFNGHYIEEAATGTFNPATALRIGTGPTPGGFGYDDPFADVVVCNAAHTVAESKFTVAQILQTIGISSMLVIEGDSFMTGEGSQPLTKYETCLGAKIQMALGDFAPSNYGVSGQTVADMNTNRAVTAETCRLPLAKRNVCFLMGGTNDIEDGDSASTIYGRLTTYATAMRAAGIKVVVGTIMDRTWDNNGAAKDAVRLTINSWIRSQGTDSFDGVVDFETNANLRDSTNTTYFMNDAIHPNAGGIATMAPMIAAAVRKIAV